MPVFFGLLPFLKRDTKMPKLSRKAAEMPESPIRKLMPFATRAKAAGKRIYHLNIGQPDIRTPQVAIDRLKDLQRDVIEYSPSQGFAGYREKLAAYYSANDIPVKPEEILITTGGSEALTFAMMACFNIGDEVIIPEPYYANYSGFATVAGIRVKPITADIDESFALPSVETFESLITEHTKGIVLCNPGNPTGYLYSREELEALADLARRRDLYLIADEVYREFCYDGAKPFSVYNLENLEKNVVLIDSVSKRYSMCGVRIGALITRNEPLRQAVLKFAQARLSPPTLGQLAAEAALDTPQSYFDEVIAEYVERRDCLVEGLRRIPGVLCPMPGGAFYCMVQLPIDDSDKFCQWLLEEFDHENETVMLAPGSGFYITRGLGKQEVRVAYVLDKKELERAVEILEIAVREYPGRTR